MEKELLNAALKYLDLGYSVIPIKPGDKRPLIKWEAYQKRKASSDEVRAWWKKNPNANIGIVTGNISGIDVVDCDSDKGVDALNEFLSDSLRVPISKTPKGYHYYFKHRSGLQNGVRILEDCDLRTSGGYIVAPPSYNVEGMQYKWVISINSSNLPLMPQILFNVLQAGANTNIINNTYAFNNIEREGGSWASTHNVVKCRQMSS